MLYGSLHPMSPMLYFGFPIRYKNENCKKNTPRFDFRPRPIIYCQRFPKNGWFVEEIFLNARFSSGILATLCDQLPWFSQIAHYLGFAILTLNRLTAIVFPLRHSKVWEANPVFVKRAIIFPNGQRHFCSLLHCHSSPVENTTTEGSWHRNEIAHSAHWTGRWPCAVWTRNLFSCFTSQLLACPT